MIARIARLGFHLPLLLVVLVCATSLGADVFETVEPATAGFEDSTLAKLDEQFSEDVEAGKIVGCVAVVARGDQVVYAKAFGDRNRESQQPMTEDTIFRIYSMSKPITSVAVMTLVEEGKLKLDEPVATYLPEFAELKVLEVTENDDGESVEKEVPVENPMTVRDLLRHTSGLTYGFFGNSPVDQRYRKAGVLATDRNLAELVTKLSKIPLLHQPGTRFQYSVSTDVLGRVVEVASGQPFDKFLQERIFSPLKMDDTFFSVPRDKQDRLAEMYSQENGALKPSPRLRSYRFLNETGFHSGGGGLCSTADDYLRFCQMLLNGGELDGARVLKAETVAEMTRNQLPGNGRGFQFGLGFRIAPNGDFGWGGAAGTRFWINSKRNVIGIFMVQINPYVGRNYEAAMKRIVYEALQEED